MARVHGHTPAFPSLRSVTSDETPSQARHKLIPLGPVAKSRVETTERICVQLRTQALLYGMPELSAS
jgi:hypothetical protein